MNSNLSQFHAPRPQSKCLEFHPSTALASHPDCAALYQKISDIKIEFVACEMFSIPAAQEKILAPEPLAEDTAHERFLNESVKKPPSGIPPYLASLYETPLLTPEQEFHLFRKMNFYNYRAAELRAAVDADTATYRQLETIEGLLQQAHAIRNQIVQANLRLVVSIARRFVDTANSFEDLVSEGNVPLIRAVEIFDYTRGYRFSTYATWAIRNSFVRFTPRSRRRSAQYLTGTQDLFEEFSDAGISPTEYEREHRQMTTLVSSMLASLDNRERTIVMSRFGLDGSGTKMKFREISSQLEISTERVRQIVARALAKLRTTLAESGTDCFDLRS
ncbi:RNA polymerase sigma factor SigA [Symmachiella macrocystis]|uniref:RNA polymerase sigma factor SigA n=1 Tax=Symmachiella macrocystis TaxID=2527985 RepID=A0A5C6BP37_9PLAN|nr:sigma-70 family RNA polymerase sigma factor [Symmachiella macrocystis]TWU13953.1 RNA polymerase sigma factor SigA [Symmachiella macrocystis]